MEVSFFFNDTATTEIYTLSLHDALPIFVGQFATGARGGYAKAGPLSLSRPPVSRPNVIARRQSQSSSVPPGCRTASSSSRRKADRKSTRLKSSHANISYAVFCLEKKKLI